MRDHTVTHSVRAASARSRVHPAQAQHGTSASASEAVFSALAHPTRRAVLDLLRQEQLPAGQIARAFPVSRPAISKHLRMLRRARLVQERREGRNRVYQLNPEPLRAVDSWLNQYRIFWEANLASLKEFIEAEHETESSSSRSKPNRKKRARKKQQ